jgi:RHS repeat-associated protein
LGRPSTAGANISYAYSGIGHNLAKISTTAPSTATNLVYGPYGALAQKTAGQWQYTLKDLHGDVVGLAAPNATAPAYSQSYDPWGNVIASAGPATSASALGYQGDPGVSGTSLVQTDTRVIDPSLGRFISQDVLFGSMSDPMSLNQYVYGEDSPTILSDPTGRGIASDCDGSQGCLDDVNNAIHYEHPGETLDSSVTPHGACETCAVAIKPQAWINPCYKCADSTGQVFSPGQNHPTGYCVAGRNSDGTCVGSDSTVCQTITVAVDVGFCKGAGGIKFTGGFSLGSGVIIGEPESNGAAHHIETMGPTVCPLFFCYGYSQTDTYNDGTNQDGYVHEAGGWHFHWRLGFGVWLFGVRGD